jgi:hypothetical protein
LVLIGKIPTVGGNRSYKDMACPDLPRIGFRMIGNIAYRQICLRRQASKYKGNIEYEQESRFF